MQQVAATGSSYVTDAGDKIAESGGRLKDDLTEKVTEGADVLKETKHSIEASAIKTAEDSKGVIDTLGVTIKETQEVIADKVRDVKDSTAEVADKTKDKVKETAQGTASFVSYIDEKITGFGTEVKEDMTSTSAKVVTGIKKAQDSIAEKVEQSTKETIIDFKEEAIHVEKQTKDDIKQMAEDTTDFISTFGEKTSKEGEKLKESTSDKMSELSSAIEDVAKPTKTGIKDKTQSAVTELGGEITHTADKLKETAASTATNIQATIGDVIKATEESASQTEQAVTSASKDISQSAKDKIDDTTKSVEKAKDKGKGKAKKAAKGAGSFFSNLGGKILGTGEKIKEDVSSKATEIASTIDESKKSVDENIETTQASLEKAEGDLKNKIKDTKKSVEAVGGEVKDTIQQVAATGSSYVTDVGDKIAESGGRLKDDLTKKVVAGTDVLKETKHSIEASAIKTAEDSEGVIDTLGVSIKETQETITDKVKGVKDSTAEVTDKTKDKVKETAQGAASFVSYVDEKVTDFGTEIKEDMSSISAKVATGIKKADDSIAEKVDEIQIATKGKMDTAKDTVDKTTTKTKSKAKKAAKGAGSFFSNLGGKILGSGEKVKDEAAMKSSDVLATIDDTAKSAAKSVEKDSKELMDTEKKKIEDTKMFIEEAKDDMNSQLSSLKDELSLKASEITTDVASTTHDIQEGAKSKMSEIKQLTDDAKRATKTTAESTSTFFIDLEKKASEVGAELKDGVTSQASEVGKILDDTATATVQSVKQAEEVGMRKTKDLFESAQVKMDESKDQAKKSVEELGKKVEQAREEITHDISTKFLHIEKMAGDAAAFAQEEVKQSKEAVIDKTDSFSTKLAQTGENIKDATATAQSHIAHSLVDSTKTASQQTKDLGATVDANIDVIGESIAKTIAKSEDSAKETAKGIGSFFSSIGDKILGTEAKVQDTIVVTSSEIATKADDDLKSKIVKIEETTRKVEIGLKDASEEISRTKEITREDIKEKTSEISSTLKDTTTSMKGSMEDAKVFVRDKGEELKHGIKDKIAGIHGTVTSVRDSAKETEQVLVSKIGGEIDEIAANVDSTKTSTVASAKEIKLVTSDKADNLKKDVERKIGDIKMASTKVTQDTKETLQKTASVTGAVFSKFGDNILGKGEQIKDKIGDIKQTVPGKVETLEEVQDTSTHISAAMEGVKSIDDTVKQTKQELTEKIRELKTDSKAEAKSIDENLKERVGEGIHQSGAFLSHLKEQSLRERETHILKEQPGDVKQSALQEVERTAMQTETTPKETVSQLDRKAGEALEKMVEIKESTSSAIDSTEKGKDKTKKATKEAGGFMSNLGKKIFGKSDKDPGADNILTKGTEDIKDATKLASSLLIEAEQITSEESATKQSLDDVSKQMEQIKKSIEEIKLKQDSVDKIPTDSKSESFSVQFKDVELTKVKTGKHPLVTSPTLPRRAESQRIPRGDIPYCVEVTSGSHDLSSDDESYIVTEPLDSSARISEESRKRKPLFHIESEDDSTEISNAHRGSTHSNVLESLSGRVDTLITDLDDYEDVIPSDTQFTSNVLYDIAQGVQEPSDTDIIEQKLNDIEKALGSLEQQEAFREGVSEIKLKRVERKFERMASAAIETDQSEGKASKLTTPEVEEKRETDFVQLVSQLSTEEVSDFQKEYAALWDEQTFSHSDEWDTLKTPDSQAEELPQGDVVYMGPVTLNKGNSVNKAGVEVDVIPIMRSPCPSPKITRKTKRAKSELGFRSGERGAEDDRGSLPDLHTYKKGIIIDTIMHAHPNMFLTPVGSSESIKSEGRMGGKSLGSADSLSKGHLMNAVVHWLQRSSPFDSTQSICSNQTSLLDETEPSTSKSDSNPIPDIFVSEDEVLVIPRQSPVFSKKNKRKNKKSKKHGKLGDSEPKLEKTETQQTAITTTTTTTTSRAETEEPTMRGTQQQSQQERPIQDQHMLSDEMKRLLQELEEESKK